MWGRMAPHGGGRAIFTGASFFSNRALAMGLHGPVSYDEVEYVENFYAARGVLSETSSAQDSSSYATMLTRVRPASR
jgi:hypothetical protein